MQPTTMNRPGAHELRRLGVQVTVSGDLARLRAKTRLTKTTLARMLNVSLSALSGYEGLDRAISKDVALRIGEWYWGATRAIQDALADGVPIHTMIPAAQAAQYLNIPLTEVETGCASGKLRAELIGTMGYYLYADALPGLTAKIIARHGWSPLSM